ncbi:MAG: hypothetical protein AB1726_12700 [Planctomycetota bacterium]
MTAATKRAVNDLEVVEGIFQRIAADLAMIIDRPFAVSETRVERANARAVGKGQVHISFKLCFKLGERTAHGCVLIPLPDAVSLAAYLMMVPDDAVKSHRTTTTLDPSTKDAMLEVGNFIGGAADAVVRSWFTDEYSIRAEGCQGVRANVRPALIYQEGDELLVGRAKGRIHEYPEFEILLMLPALDGMRAP